MSLFSAVRPSLDIILDREERPERHLSPRSKIMSKLAATRKFCPVKKISFSFQRCAWLDIGKSIENSTDLSLNYSIENSTDYAKICLFPPFCNCLLGYRTTSFDSTEQSRTDITQTYQNFGAFA